MSDRIYDELTEQVHLSDGIGQRATWVLYGCPDCGAVVYGREEHDRWHMLVDPIRLFGL